MAVGHFQYAVRLCLLQFGEKTLVAEIDAEDRNAGTGEIPGKLQNRTVAAERDDEPRAGQRHRKSSGRDIARPGVFQPVAEEGRDAHFMSVLAQRLGNGERGSKAVVAVGVRTEQNISVFHFSESFPCAA